MRRTYPGRVKTRLQYPTLVRQHNDGFLGLSIQRWDRPFTDLPIVTSCQKRLSFRVGVETLQPWIKGKPLSVDIVQIFMMSNSYPWCAYPNAYHDRCLDLKDEKALSCKDVPHADTAVLWCREQIVIVERVCLDVGNSIYQEGEYRLQLIWLVQYLCLRLRTSRTALRLTTMSCETNEFLGSWETEDVNDFVCTSRCKNSILRLVNPAARQHFL